MPESECLFSWQACAFILSQGPCSTGALDTTCWHYIIATHITSVTKTFIIWIDTIQIEGFYMFTFVIRDKSITDYRVSSNFKAADLMSQIDWNESKNTWLDCLLIIVSIWINHLKKDGICSTLYRNIWQIILRSSTFKYTYSSHCTHFGFLKKLSYTKIKLVGLY